MTPKLARYRELAERHVRLALLNDLRARLDHASMDQLVAISTLLKGTGEPITQWRRLEEDQS